MKNAYESVKLKIVIVMLLITTMLFSLVVPIAQATGEEETINEYVEFTANWANGTNENNIGSEKPGYILFNLKLSGVPTGFQNLKIYATEETVNSETALPAASMQFESLEYADNSRDKMLIFDSTMNSGINIGGTLDVSFPKTADLSEYDKNIKLTLVGTYKNPITGTNEDVSKTITLSAHITPTEADAFTVTTNYDNTKYSVPQKLDNFWKTEWVTTEFGGTINLNIRANNASYLEYNIEIDKNDNELMQYPSNFTIDLHQLEEFGFNVIKTTEDDEDKINIKLTYGEKDNAYAEDEIYDINERFEIPVTYVVPEGLINKWNGGILEFDYIITGNGQGYTVVKSKNGTVSNNRENYSYEGEFKPVRVDPGEFEYLFHININNSVEEKTRADLDKEILSGKIEINSQMDIAVQDYRLEEERQDIKVGLNNKQFFVYYYDANGVKRYKNISSIAYVKNISNNNCPYTLELVEGSTSTQDKIKSTDYCLSFEQEHGKRTISLSLDYSISVEDLKTAIGEENVNRIISFYTEEYAEFSSLGRGALRTAEPVQNILNVIKDLYEGNSKYLEDGRDNSVFVCETGNLVTLTDEEIENINKTYPDLYNSVLLWTNEGINEADNTTITKTINGKETKIYSIEAGNNFLQFAYPDYQASFETSVDANGQPVYSTLSTRDIYDAFETEGKPVMRMYSNITFPDGNSNQKQLRTTVDKDVLMSVNQVLKTFTANYGVYEAIPCYDYCSIIGEVNEELSYLQVCANDYDTSATAVGKLEPQKTITLKMYHNSKVLKTQNKIVKNTNPKIYVELPKDFAYNIKDVIINNGNGKLYIPQEYTQTESMNGVTYNTGWYVIKAENGTNYLVINCIGEYNSSTDSEMTIDIKHSRKLLTSEVSAEQYIKAYMITDNENYITKFYNYNKFAKDDNTPVNTFYGSDTFYVEKSNNVSVRTGMYVNGEEYKPSGESTDGSSSSASSKTNPVIFRKSETVKYFSKILNNTSEQITNINMVTRLPLAGNTSIVGTTYKLLEDNYVLPTAFWEKHQNTELGGLTSESVIPQISLSNIQNIKIYSISNKGTKKELSTTDYNLYYSTDATAGLDSTYTEYVPGTTDLSSAKTLKVELREGYILPARANIILEYEMTMPDTDGMVGETAAVSYLKVGDTNSTILEPIAAYVMTGENGSIELTKTFQGCAAGVVPEGLTTIDGITLTTLQGIEFKITYEDANGVEQPLVIPGQTDSNGVAITDSNGKIKITDVPNGTYKITEITKFKKYDSIGWKTAIVENSESVEIDAENKLKLGSLTINKQWEDTNDQQGKATFKITRTDGDYEYTAQITTDPVTGVATARGIPYGTYTVEEISGVYGWYGENLTATIDENNVNATLDYENKIGKGTIKITKTVPTGDAVTGLKFAIKGNGYVNYKNKENIQVSTDTYNEVTIGNDYSTNENINVEIADNGKSATITLSNMLLGIYTIEEVDMPTIGEGDNQTEKYVAISRTIGLDKNRNTETISLSNQWKTGNIIITKTATDGVDLTQFQVRVTCDETQYGTSYDRTFTFPEDGKLTIPGLILGEYKVEEIESDYYNAYYSVEQNGQTVRMATPQNYKIKYNQTTDVSIYNESTTGYVKILKTLEGKDAEEAVGLKFNVTGYDPTGTWISKEIELTKTEEISGTKYAVGTSEAILAGGEYVITESNTPEYYEDIEETSVDIKKTNTLENPAIINIENKRAKGNLDISTVTIPEGGPLYPIVYRVVEVEIDGNSYKEVAGTEQTINANATGAEVLKSINAGNYKVEQTKVPDGYTKDLAQIVEVPSNGTGYAIFEIEKIEELENTTLTIKKEILNSKGEVATEEEITDAKLDVNESFEVKLTNVDTQDVYYTFVSSKEDGIIKGLPQGTYEIEEMYKPKYTTTSYAQKIESVYGTIEPNSGKYMITIGDEQTSTNVVEIRIQNSIDTTFKFGGQVHCDNLSKIDTEDEEVTKPTKTVIYIMDEQGNALPGATFKLLDSNGDRVQLGTSENIFVSNNKKLIIKGLPEGTYTLVCTSVPDGYLVPKDKQIIVYKDASRVVRVEIQKNIPRGILTLSSVYKDENNIDRFVPRSKYMIMNSATGELLTFEKALDGTYVTSNTATATDTINVKAGSMQITGIPAGIEYQVALVDVTEKYGVATSTPETIMVEEGITQEVQVPVKERTGWTSVTAFGDTSEIVAIDSNGEVWGYSRYSSSLNPSGSNTEFCRLLEYPGFENIIGVKFVKGYCGALLDSEGKVWEYKTEKDPQEYQMVCRSNIEGHPFNGLKIKEIVTGDNSKGICALDENGKVWKWNGTGTTPICLSTGTSIENLQIVDLDIGYAGYILMVDSNGDVWSKGTNNHGECGINPINNNEAHEIEQITCINPGSNLEGVKIKDVEAGYECSILIDESNRIWTCGYKYNMGLGTNETGIQWNPICLTTLEGNPLYGIKIKTASTDNGIIGLIDFQGRLWSWGDNGRYGLGLHASSIPVCISELEDCKLKGIKLKSIGGLRIGNSSCALDEDGNMWLWGYNAPFGKRWETSEVSPEKITLPTNSYFTLRRKFTKVGTARYFASAIDESGRLWCWGRNYQNMFGTLFDGVGVQYKNPVCLNDNYRFNELSKNKIIDVSQTDQAIYVLDEKGQVWNWGYSGLAYNVENNSNFLPVCINKIEGNPLYGKQVKFITTDYGNVSVIDTEGKLYITNSLTCINDTYQELASVEFTKISMYGSTYVVIDSENRLWAWGSNSSGCLATGTTENVDTPLCISNLESSPLKNVKVVDASYNGGGTLILDENGKVWGCGSGYFGTGKYETITTPICISNIETNPIYGKTIVNVNNIPNGRGYVLVDSENNIWTCGETSNNGLGYDTFIPVNISAIYGVKAKSVSTARYGDYTIIIDTDDQLWGWSNSDTYGILSNTIGNTTVTYPTKLMGTTKYTNNNSNKIFTDVNSEGLITDTTGKKYKAEFNALEGICEYIPEQKTIDDSMLVEEVQNIKQSKNNVILDNDGKVWTKGTNGYGQLGDGTTTRRTKYACISNLEDNPLNDVEISEILVADGFKVILKDTEGEFWYFGSSDNKATLPTKIEGMSIVTANNIYWIPQFCSTINNSFYIISDSGDIWYMDNNEIKCLNQQYVNLSTVDFVEVYPLGGTCRALDNAGNLWCWGNNSLGQLGIGNRTNTTEPTKATISNIKKVVYYDYNMAIVQNTANEYLACGENEDGVLGIGKSNNDIISTFTIISQLSGKEITSIIRTNYDTMVAMDSDGKIWTWGNNENGQCGNGQTTVQLAPICVNTTNNSALGSVQFTSVEGTNIITATDSTNKKWIWGSNANCEIEFSDKTIITPQEYTDRFQAKGINFAEQLTSNIIKDTDGNIWGWGSNYNGIFGVTERTVFRVPVNITQNYFAAGCTISEVLYIDNNILIVKDNNGNLWGTGYDNYNVFGKGQREYTTTPTKLSNDLNVNNAVYMNISANNIIVLTSTGKLYTSATTCVNNTAESPLNGKTIAKVCYLPSSGCVVITNEGKLYLIDKNNTVKDTSGVLYERTSTWDTGFVLLRDAKYNQ